MSRGAQACPARRSNRWALAPGDNGPWRRPALTPRSGSSSRTPRPVAGRTSHHRRSARSPAVESASRATARLWVNTFMDAPPLLRTSATLAHARPTRITAAGHISRRLDGKRSTSLVAPGHWDKGALTTSSSCAFTWDGKELTQVFEVDFNQEKLGPRAPHEAAVSRSAERRRPGDPRGGRAGLVLLTWLACALPRAHEPSRCPRSLRAAGRRTSHAARSWPRRRPGAGRRPAAASRVHARAHSPCSLHYTTCLDPDRLPVASRFDTVRDRWAVRRCATACGS